MPPAYRADFPVLKIEIHVYENEVKRATPFLDVSGIIASGGEQGLLGLAFHPSYGCNGQFFVYYTTITSNVVARCTVSADPNIANPTCTPILTIPSDRDQRRPCYGYERRDP